MEPNAHARLEALLTELEAGNEEAFGALVEVAYAEFRGMAERMAGRRDATLQPTALVHELFLRFARSDDHAWRGRGHLMAASARAMRQILNDHARRRGSLKRGDPGRRITLDESIGAPSEPTIDAIDLDGALSDLAALHARQAEIVELHYLGGMTCAEIAERLAIGQRTVELDLSMARSFLRRRLDGGAE